MKLLKYSQQLHEGNLTCISVWKHFLVMVGNQMVSIWNCSKLVKTALGELDTKDLKCEWSIKLDLDNEIGRYLIVTEDKLLVGSDHLIILFNNWSLLNSVKEDEYILKLDKKEGNVLTDMKYDSVNGLLFVLISKKNCIWIYRLSTMKKFTEIILHAKPITAIVDPIGQLLTIIMENRSIFIYQYEADGRNELNFQFTQYTQVNPLPYKITMSPQGDMLPILNSLKSKIPSAVLLNRNDNFKVESTLVGYWDKCRIFKFSPVLYEKTTKLEITKYNLLASSGNDDGGIVVWNTKRTKPLFSVANISKTFISDLEWSTDGTALFAVSNDGYMFVFAFQEVELGKILPSEELITLQALTKRLTPLHALQDDQKLEIKKQDSVSSFSKNKIENNTNVKSLKKKIIPMVVKSSSMEFNSPSYSVPKDLKRKPLGAEEISVSNQKKTKRELEPMDFLDTNVLMPNISFSKVRISSPKVRLNFQYISPHDESIVMEIKNGTGNEQKPTIISLTLKDKEQDQILFQDFTPKFITMCTSGDTFWACCSDDGVIYVYSTTGKKLFPLLIMGVPISFLEGNGSFLLCLTNLGQLYCWDIPNSKIKFPMNSIYSLLSPTLRYSDDILTRAENITMCTVTKNGVPIVTLSNGDGYIFDSDMESWMLVNDSWWAYGSQYWNFTNTTVPNANLINNSRNEKKNKYWNPEADRLLTSIEKNDCSLIYYLESKTNDELNRKGRARNLQRFAKTILMKEGFENLEEIVTLSHLENKIMVSLKLNENEEFSKLLVLYCIRLGEMGYVNRLDDVLQWLYNDGNYKDSHIANKTRENLLKDIIAACANIRQVQRVTNSYATELGLINELM